MNYVLTSTISFPKFSLSLSLSPPLSFSYKRTVWQKADT
jgi:hypothetical protein